MRATTLAVALLISVQSLAAQQPTRADSVPRQVKQMQGEMMQSMGPMMVQMAIASMEATLTALAKPENAELAAKFTKNYYDALVKLGFTPEQALQIVIAAGLPRSTVPGR